MIRMLLIAVSVTVAVPAIARAQEQRTIRGEVVAAACYNGPLEQSAMDADARSSCSLSALKAGEPAGVVDQQTGKLYIVVSGDGSDISSKLLPNVAKLVDVTGTVQERQGIDTIMASDIRPVENSPSKAGTTGPGNMTAGNASRGNAASDNATGVPSGALGSGDEPVPLVPWAGGGASNRNDTLYNTTKSPGIHNSTTRELKGIPNRGTRTGEVYINEGERNVDRNDTRNDTREAR